MSKFLTAVAAVVVLALAGCSNKKSEVATESHNAPVKVQPKDNTPPPGFVAAFNGKDLTGWKGLLDPRKKLDNPFNRAKLTPDELAAAQKEADDNMRAHWSVQDGTLVFDGKGRNLCTARDYGD